MQRSGDLENARKRGLVDGSRSPIRSDEKVESFTVEIVARVVEQQAITFEKGSLRDFVEQVVAWALLLLFEEACCSFQGLI